MGSTRYDVPSGSGQEGRDAVLGTSDDRSIAAHQDRTLHQAGVLDEQIGDRLRRRVVVGVELEALEEAVLADEIGRWIVELGEEVEQGGPLQGCLEVLDDLGVDAGRHGLVDRMS